MQKTRISSIITIAALSLATAHADLTGWTATYATDHAYDIGNKGHPYLDIVGGFDSTGQPFSSAYLQLQSTLDDPTRAEDLVLFRFRLDGLKKTMPGAWMVLFDTDADSHIDWALRLQTSNLANGGTVEFGRASGDSTTTLEFGSATWSDSSSTYIGFDGTSTPDGSRFNNNPDYFLDLSMPWAEFSAQTGLANTDHVRVLVATSQDGSSMNNGDFAGTDRFAELSFGDVFAVIPEPASAALILGAGSLLFFANRFFGDAI